MEKKGNSFLVVGYSDMEKQTPPPRTLRTGRIRRDSLAGGVFRKGGHEKRIGEYYGNRSRGRAGAFDPHT